MSEQSTSALERDAERVRAQIADTADHLKEKMSPGQLMDEVVNYFKNGDSSQFLGNLKHQVRDNPLALALVGSGLAWLMMGSRADGAAGTPSRNSLAGNGLNNRPLAGSNTYGDPAGSSTSSVSDESSLGESVATIGETVRDLAGSVADSATRGLHDLRDAASERSSQASRISSAAAERTKSTFLDALDREPLVLGALGVAVGAAIGAMLPTSSVEQDYFGEASEKVRKSAGDMMVDGIDKAKEVASDAYSAARDEADSQGLASDGRPITEKLADVAKAAGAEIKAAAVDTVDKVEAAADDTSEKWS